MSKKVAKYISILIIVLIPAAVILSNLSLLATNYNFYIKIFQNKNIYDNFTNHQILEAETRGLTGYFKGKNVLDQNFYSKQAVRHLKDVRNLLNAAILLNVVFLSLIFLISIALYFNKERKNLINSYLKGSLVTLVLITGISALLLFNFQKLFFDFHLIFFRNNDWLFDPGDNLVKMFPQEFFVSFALYLAGNIIATALFIVLFALIIKRINAKSHT